MSEAVIMSTHSNVGLSFLIFFITFRCLYCVCLVWVLYLKSHSLLSMSGYMKL